MPREIFDVATAVDDGDACLLDVDLFFDINNGCICSLVALCS
jgi:hypothetical protein